MVIMKFNKNIQHSLSLLHDEHLLEELRHAKIDERVTESLTKKIERSARDSAIVCAVNNAIKSGHGKHTAENGAYFIVAQEFPLSPEAICKVYVKHSGK